MTEPVTEVVDNENRAVRGRVRKFYFKTLRKRLLQWGPTRRFIRAREMREALQHWNKDDDEENARSLPPADEVVALQGIWAAEFYTPSQTESLFQGFARLGWDQESDLHRESPVIWIRGQRGTMHGGGWLNLGFITSAPDHSFRSDRTAPLPRGVKYASGSIFTLTSSLACIVIFFAYDETRSQEYQRALTSTKKTFLSPSKQGGFTVRSPESQKEEDIEAIRKQSRREAWEWFHEHLPGVFATARKLPKNFPTCELVTTAVAEPFPIRTSDKPMPRYLDLLGLARTFDAWEAKEIPELKAGLFQRRQKSHVMFAAKMDLLEATGKKHHYHDAVGFADQALHVFVSRWGLIALFDFLQRRVNALRDNLRRHAGEGASALKSLETLTNVELRSLDTITVANDIRQFAAQDSWFQRDVADFKAIETRTQHRQPIDTSLVTNLRVHLSDQAKWLLSADEQVRRALTQQAGLLATRENIRLQRWMAVLTIVGAILALVSVVTATDAGKATLNHLVDWASSVSVF